MNQAKTTIFYSKRCNFFVDTNNLVNFQMVETIINKFDDKTINRLNEVLNGIKFYVGGHHWHINDKGYIKYPAFEFNFHERMLLIHLHKIFDLGYKRWKSMMYGALRRFIWESFCHEIIMTVVHMIKLDLNLAEHAKEYFLNEDTNFNYKFISELFSYEENFPLRVNFIEINNSLWHELIPYLGFLDVLHKRKINQLKDTINKSKPFLKIKFFNELRKQKLKYEYEYNFSELVNYCIHNDYFESFFTNNWEMYRKIHREFYYKAKRLILKFFKQYNITDELKEYKDSANRSHYFLTHKTFERVKSACLQTCIVNIKNKSLEEFTYFREFYSKCPICKQENINLTNCEKFYFSLKYSFFKEILFEKMNEFESLDEINVDDEYFFGIPCDDCFEIVRNIQGKYLDLNQVDNFMITYSTCPLCGAKNHRSYLLSFYHDDKQKRLRDYLIQTMELIKKKKNYKINIGIPCCVCFKNVFGEEPGNFNLNYLL